MAKQQGVVTTADLRRYAGSAANGGWQEEEISWALFDGLRFHSGNPIRAEKYYLRNKALMLVVTCTYDESCLKGELEAIRGVLTQLAPLL